MLPPPAAADPHAAPRRPTGRAPILATLWALMLGLLGAGAGVLAAAVPLVAEATAEAREPGGEASGEDDLLGGATWQRRGVAGASGDRPADADLSDHDHVTLLQLGAVPPALAAPTLVSTTRWHADDRASRLHVLLAAIRPRPPTTSL